MSQIITFYSYKGGVGRSMALANVATLLSKWGKKVLMIDWDLEAPGLEFFFKPYLPEIDWSQQKGVLEWLYAVQNQEDAKWQDWIIPFKTKISKADLHLLVAGKSNGNYSEMLRQFSVSKFYDEHRGGHIIEQFREELLANYDYILIDSRTGVTDFGGICTIQMPDILVMLFSATEQGLTGTLKIAQRAEAAHQKLPFDRYKLLICPVPSRISSTTEYETSRTWLARIGETLKIYYEDWVPTSIDIREFMQLIKIPNIDYFSFGESLPVIEQGVIDPAGLGYAYENLAMLLGRGLDVVDEFVEKRDIYLERVSGQKPEQKILDMAFSTPHDPVRVFISAASADENLKHQIERNLKHLPPLSDSVELVESSYEFLGKSRKEALESMIRTTDIVLIIFSKNYFISEKELSPIEEIGEEFYMIRKYQKEFIPIFISNDIAVSFRKKYDDRVGINLFSYNGDAVKLIVEKIVPLIHDIYKDINLKKDTVSTQE